MPITRNTKKHPGGKAARCRVRRRGAAMVEAAVVMPIIVMFFGLITFAYRDITVQQDLMLTSRHKAFQNSLRSCPGGGGSGGAGSGGFGEQVNGAGDSGGEQGNLANSAGASSVLKQTFGVTTAKESGTSTNSPLSTVIRSRNRTSTSYVYCSPETGFLSGLTGLISSILGMAAGFIFK